MAPVQGFWSYVHADDEAEGRRITRIAADLGTQYGLITGEAIEIFVDRDQIEWGDEWRSLIDTALSSIVFFIPVITPRYFESEECRREFNAFARRARKLGVDELIMPILYVRPPALDSDPPVDELMALVKQFQWEDWTSLRFESPDSPAYRSAVARMAERLARAGALAEKVDAVSEVPDGDDDDDDSPGLTDRIARSQDAMEEWTETIDRISSIITEIGTIIEASGKRLKVADTRPKAAAARLEVYRQLSNSLSDPVARLQELGNGFTLQMNDVDSGIRALLEGAETELADKSGAEREELLGVLRNFQGSIDNLADNADAGLGSLGEMVSAIESVENQSRNLRPMLRKMKRSLTVLMDGRQVINGWSDQIAEFMDRNEDAVGGS